MSCEGHRVAFTQAMLAIYPGAGLSETDVERVFQEHRAKHPAATYETLVAGLQAGMRLDVSVQTKPTAFNRLRSAPGEVFPQWKFDFFDEAGRLTPAAHQSLAAEGHNPAAVAESPTAQLLRDWYAVGDDPDLLKLAGGAPSDFGPEKQGQVADLALKIQATPSNLIGSDLPNLAGVCLKAYNQYQQRRDDPSRAARFRAAASGFMGAMARESSLPRCPTCQQFIGRTGQHVCDVALVRAHRMGVVREAIEKSLNWPAPGRPTSDEVLAGMALREVLADTTASPYEVIGATRRMMLATSPGSRAEQVQRTQLANLLDEAEAGRRNCNRCGKWESDYLPCPGPHRETPADGAADDDKESCGHCGRRVYERDLTYIGGEEYCRFCQDEAPAGDSPASGFVFTAESPMGAIETFDGYYTEADLAAAQGRLRAKGYTDFRPVEGEAARSPFSDLLAFAETSPEALRAAANVLLTNDEGPDVYDSEGGPTPLLPTQHALADEVDDLLHWLADYSAIPGDWDEQAAVDWPRTRTDLAYARQVLGSMPLDAEMTLRANGDKIPWERLGYPAMPGFAAPEVARILHAARRCAADPTTLEAVARDFDLPPATFTAALTRGEAGQPLEAAHRHALLALAEKGLGSLRQVALRGRVGMALKTSAPAAPLMAKFQALAGQYLQAASPKSTAITAAQTALGQAQAENDGIGVLVAARALLKAQAAAPRQTQMQHENQTAFRAALEEALREAPPLVRAEVELHEAATAVGRMQAEVGLTANFDRWPVAKLRQTAKKLDLALPPQAQGVAPLRFAMTRATETTRRNFDKAAARYVVASGLQALPTMRQPLQPGASTVLDVPGVANAQVHLSRSRVDGEYLAMLLLAPTVPGPRPVLEGRANDAEGALNDLYAYIHQEATPAPEGGA